MPRAAILGALLALPVAARAEVELSFYGGLQGAPHSGLAIEGEPGVPDFDGTAGWEGRSFTTPIQAGVRLTVWRPSDWGFGVEVNHAKVYADGETLDEAGVDHLEFSDGLNIATVNLMRRFPGAFEGRLGGALDRVTPYLGGGVGVAVPHVELRSQGPGDGAEETWGYQLTGPAVAVMAGASLGLTERWSAFGEYKATYSMNEADLDGGGRLSTDIVTNAFNFGLSYRF